MTEASHPALKWFEGAVDTQGNDLGGKNGDGSEDDPLADV